MRFVDTNVLIYAVSVLSENAVKQRISLDLLDEEDYSISVQVLQEFYHQATRPSRPDTISQSRALRFIGEL